MHARRFAIARWPAHNKQAAPAIDADARNDHSTSHRLRYTRLDMTMPQCSTARDKIVSNKIREKKFLLNCFSFDEAGSCTLLSARGCDTNSAV
jgi:hypothetical protein